MVGQGIGHNQEALLICGNLHIVVLVEAFVGAVLHDARIRIREVVLIFVAWPWRGWLGRWSPGLATFLFGFLFPRTFLGLILGQFGFVVLLGPSLQDGLGLSHVCQPLLAQSYLFLDFQTFGQFDLVGLLGQGQQLLHFLFKQGFEFLQTFVTHGLALGGIGMNFRPVQANVTQFKIACFLGQHQDFNKQPLDLGQKRLAKVGDGIVVRVQVAGNEAKWDRFVGRLFDLARTEHTRSVPIEQQSQQDFRGIRWCPQGLVLAVDRIQIQLGHDPDHETSQMVKWQNVSQADLEIKDFFVIDGYEFSSHTQSLHRMPERSKTSPTDC